MANVKLRSLKMGSRGLVPASPASQARRCDKRLRPPAVFFACSSIGFAEHTALLRTARINGCENAKVVGRWHDNRHTLVTELAESGAGDEVIMSIAGHVSRAMLSRYSHVRMEAKRRALDEIAAPWRG